MLNTYIFGANLYQERRAAFKDKKKSSIENIKVIKGKRYELPEFLVENINKNPEKTLLNNILKNQRIKELKMAISQLSTNQQKLINKMLEKKPDGTLKSIEELAGELKINDLKYLRVKIFDTVERLSRKLKLLERRIIK